MTLVMQGGFFFIAIGALGFLVVLIAVERFLKLSVAYRLNARSLVEKLKTAFLTKDAIAAEEICQENKSKPLARVLEAGIRARTKSLDELHISLEAEIAYWIPQIEQRVGALATLANISTLLGLVGTVLGLIKSFGALGGDLAATASRSQALASGVSESMLTTAAGLVVAIPALLSHLYLSGAARRLIAELDYGALELKKMILEYKQGHPALRQSAIKPLGSSHRTIGDMIASEEKVVQEMNRQSSAVRRDQGILDELTSEEVPSPDFWLTKPERKV